MAELTIAQKIAALALQVFQNLPLITSLAPGALALVQNAIAIFQGFKDNPNATIADVDAAIAKIQAQSAQIQAMK